MKFLNKLPYLKNIPEKDISVTFLLGVSAGFLLFGYEFVRTSSSVLFKTSYSPESLPIVMTLSPVALLFMMYIYEKILLKLGPRKTLFWTTVLSGLVLLIGYIAVMAGVRIASAAMFIFKSAYIVLIIEQYWSFINSSIQEGSAKKLNGPLVGISSIGAILGGLAVGGLAKSLGSEAMILIAALSMLPCALVSEYAFRHYGASVKSEFEKDEKEDASNRFGIKEFSRYPSLIYILAIVLFTQFLAAVLQINFHTVVHEVYPDKDIQTSVLGNFFAAVNAMAFFFQFIGAPILLTFLSPYAVQFLIPLVHIVSCVALNLHPGFMTIGIAFLLFKSLDYSLFRASKEVLYIPMSFDARYRAKELIDVFGYRFGKGIFSLGITALQNSGLQMAAWYSPIGFVITFIWFVLVFPMKNLHRGSKKSY